jgi:cell division septum initiation protein DivIVA
VTVSARSLVSPATIREASLPKGLRGFDEAATRKFLAAVADTVQTLMDQRDKLERSLAELNEQRSADREDPAVIGNVLLAAQRAGEELVAHARATAAQITAEAQETSERQLEEARRSLAEAERQVQESREAYEREHAGLRSELDELRGNLEAERRSVIDEARAEAARAVEESRETLDALQREAQALSELITERRNQFADLLQSALDRIGTQDLAGGETETELTTVLRSRVTDAQSH